MKKKRCNLLPPHRPFGTWKTCLDSSESFKKAFGWSLCSRTQFSGERSLAVRVRDFKVKDAFTKLNNTIRWRKEFGIDELLKQDLGCDDLGKVVYMHGLAKEGRPVCYNVYGEFQNKELCKNLFSDEEKRQRFLR